MLKLYYKFNFATEPSIKYDNEKLLRNPSEERKKEIREAIKQENIKQFKKKSNEEDELEELVDLDVNQL